MSDTTEKPVFFDPTQRRTIYFTRFLAIAGFTATIVLTIFWASVLTVPVSHRIRLNAPRFLPDNALRAAATLDRKRSAKTPREDTRRVHKHSVPVKAPILSKSSRYDAQNPIIGAFYVSWDEVSLASLRQHAGELTHLFPGWLHLDNDGGRLIITDNDNADIEARRIAQEKHLTIVPLLNNFSADINDFEESRLHALLISPEKRQKVATQIRDYLLQNGYAGINIDLETEDEDDRALLSIFTAEVAAVLRPAHLLISQDIQVGDGEENGAIASSCDFVVPMIYDLHYAGGEAGPIAPQEWAQQELDKVLKTIPASKVVLAIGNYAYNWERGKIGAQTLTFGEAMATARESLDSGESPVRFDRETRNPTFSYTESDGKRHDVWLLDAATAYNFQRYAAEKGVNGRALWYIGSEDPTLWTFFGKGRRPQSPQSLSIVRYGFEIDFEGEGEILDIVAQPHAGKRTLDVASNGVIVNESFLSYPSTYIVRRTGWNRDTKGKLDKRLALTFDDGPDINWTPQVLNALKKAGVPATFFVIGEYVESYPELVRREWDQGHEIGNHSFYHPNLALVSGTRANLEISATQRAIQAATGRSTTLFRPPYGVDVEPSTVSDLIPVEEAEKLGYVTVAEGIDPKDWHLQDHPTPEIIAQRIIDGAHSGQGNVVLLHDSGGDRAATVAAIPLFVQRLKAEGYTFVPVSALISGARRDTIMPPVVGREAWVALVDRQVFGITRRTIETVTFLFIFTLIAGTIRLIFVAGLAVAQKKQERQSLTDLDASGATPTVSVIIAAYNEEKVIAQTVRALLDGGYPHLEVIVVDDGSRDGTAKVVAQEFATDPRVRLIVKENGGKASALNRGITLATGEVLVGLDADTLFAPDTVHRLARHFADPSVGAVAGNIEVGNRINLLTRWQAVEYVTSQNFDRRAYAMLNSVPVVPGCVGAWRASAVREAGGYESDTLAEDADLTWRVRRQGWRIVTDATARAYTEAPDKLRDLMKQRYRWTFGTLQTLWKHRDICFRPRYGWFGCLVVPSLWIFQIVLPLALPFADIGLILAALSGSLNQALLYFAFFFCAEFLAAYLAFRMDNASWSRLADLRYLFLQRIVWRYLLFWTLVRALTAAMRGGRNGWNKLERKGTAVVRNT